MVKKDYFNIINKLRKKNSVPLSKLVVQRKEKFKKESEIFNYIEIVVCNDESLVAGLVCGALWV